MNTPNIIDISIKEGAFRIHHQISDEQVGSICRELSRSGIEYAEISHGCGVGSFNHGYPGLHSDKALLKAAEMAAPGLKRIIYIYPSIHCLPEIDPLADSFEIARIGVNANEISMAEPHIAKLLKHNKKIMGQLLRCHRFTPEEIADSAYKLSELGCEIIYLSDTFGSMTPNDIENYLSAIQTKISHQIGFQGRNNCGFAMANTLTALDAGAQWVDASLMGMGAGSGVTNLEVLIGLLQVQKKCLDIDLAELCFAAQHQIQPSYGSPPYTTLMDLHFAKYKLDYYPQELILKLASILDWSPEQFLKKLIIDNPDIVQIRDQHIRNLLKIEKLDFDVVLDYIKTGNIPGFSITDTE